MRIGVMESRKTSPLDEMQMATCDEVKRARVKYVKFRLWNYIENIAHTAAGF